MRRVLLLALLALPPPALADEDKSRRLEDVERKIQDAQQAAQSIASKTESVLDAMEKLDRSIASRERRLKALAENVRDAEERRAAAERRLAVLDAELPRLTFLLSARARGLYRLTRRGLGPIVFQAPRDWSDATRYRHALQTVIERDQRLLAEVIRNRAAADAAKRDAAAQAAALEAQRREVEKELDSQRSERASKRELLASLRGQREQQSRLIEELKASAERLHDLIEREEASKAKRFEAPRSAQGARMRPPIAAGIEAVAAARNGVEIRSAAGTPVVAVKAGRVVFAGWFSGYGQMVILEHGDRLYSVYGYASELLVERGLAVDAGQPIAKVGATGPVSSPSLYFEIRDHGSAQDPTAYVPSLARK